MIELTDADLLLKLRNFEDHFVERKTSGDHKDWLKTIVDIANSVPIGYPAVLFIGAKDNGDIEEGGSFDRTGVALDRPNGRLGSWAIATDAINTRRAASILVMPSA